MPRTSGKTARDGGGGIDGDLVEPLHEGLGSGPPKEEPGLAAEPLVWSLGQREHVFFVLGRPPHFQGGQGKDLLGGISGPVLQRFNGPVPDRGLGGGIPAAVQKAVAVDVVGPECAALAPKFQQNQLEQSGVLLVVERAVDGLVAHTLRRVLDQGRNQRAGRLRPGPVDPVRDRAALGGIKFRQPVGEELKAARNRQMRQGHRTVDLQSRILQGGQKIQQGGGQGLDGSQLLEGGFGRRGRCPERTRDPLPNRSRKAS